MKLSRIGLVLAPILVTSATFLPSQVRAQSRITSVGDAALNAADYCHKNAPAFLRDRPTHIKIMGIRCSEIVHKVVAALRAAKYRPTGLNLQSDRDLTVFINGASPILERDASVIESIKYAREVFRDNVIETILLGAIGAYAYLDFGIDITHNSRNRMLETSQAARNPGNLRASSRSNSSTVALPPPNLPSLNLPPANAQKKILNRQVLAQISNNICQKYVSFQQKYQACNRLTVSGVSALDNSRLNPIGVNLRNDLQFQAYLKKAGEVLTKDNYFISSFTLASSHLTKQETSNIYLSIIIAYSAFKNQGY
ncbi:MULTISPECIES: hypothetical protein [Nostocales]|uniref:Uncharacterized protein n=3 Tax=Nostocales TaxID=1161 RepID=A0A8S9TFH3_9CYAN|nr:hypothetical protein [Tolypothrix bouteillei]KAF3890043.1 hypothetical protein DA73_0400034740 [Tolypothrix bouteillei VB521301]